jgi:hypothetical protein
MHLQTKMPTMTHEFLPWRGGVDDTWEFAGGGPVRLPAKIGLPGLGVIIDPSEARRGISDRTVD